MSVGRIHLIFVAVCLAVIAWAGSASAQTLAPGGPGKDAQWATAGKQAVGTSASLESKVWFTLAQGVMTEVYYPDVTVANVHLLQFFVVHRKTGKIETEQENTASKVESRTISRSKNLSPISNIYVGKHFSSHSSMAFDQNTWSESGKWGVYKTYLTDPQSNTILISVGFRSQNPDLALYVYYDPSLNNSGMHDSGWTEARAFLSTDGQVASALTCGRCRMTESTNGFFGVNDGLTQLRNSGKIAIAFDRAENGNIVQVAKVTPVSVGVSSNMVFALSFAKTPAEAVASAQEALAKGYEKSYAEYQEGWINYLVTLPVVDPKYEAQFNMAAMQLKALEDKTHRGANIASLTVPWGGGVNANENMVGGYHLVWSRDLYHVFTAYMALGDKAAAERALDFLFKVQQKPDGSFPQNSWLDGKPFWGSLQMDEVAYPLIMAWQLGRFDKPTWEKHIKKAADFIVKNGPMTPQERWEEEGGYSPSTIAAEIAGLVCAAEIATRNGDNASAHLYLKTADDWQANIENWTATKTGKYGDGNYYLRITQNGKPDAGEKIEINNGSGFFDERDIVDAGFLELVRLGIKPSDDPLIAKSVKVIDQVIKVDTPSGEAFYRYNHDGYGEMDDGRRWNWDGKYTGKGRLWALLTGERGQYELARCGTQSAVLRVGRQIPTIEYGSPECPKIFQYRLDSMLGFANESLMIPEQVWDKKENPKNIDRQFVPDLKFGEGTGSATPLAWSMAQFIRLAVNLKAGRNLDTPQVVYDRYVLRKK
ncbi:MAG: glycoside hydrolase family 15 protein [Pyrinomonadaceae bacterium]